MLNTIELELTYKSRSTVGLELPTQSKARVLTHYSHSCSASMPRIIRESSHSVLHDDSSHQTSHLTHTTNRQKTPNAFDSNDFGHNRRFLPDPKHPANAFTIAIFRKNQKRFALRFLQLIAVTKILNQLPSTADRIPLHCRTRTVLHEIPVFRSLQT